MLTGAWKQAITVFLLIIFINSCVQIEIRDRRPPVYRKQETLSQPTKETPKPKEPAREQEVKPLTVEVPKVPMPVKGVPIRTQRGYFIKSSCDESFRAVEKGKVLYAGDNLKGYGWVVIVEQEDGYITVYTRAERVFVKKGESVKRVRCLERKESKGRTVA